MRPLAVAALFAALFASPAAAQDPWKVDKSSCIGAYGALARQKDQLVAWAPALGKTNFVSIDWAARKAQLLGGSSIYEAASKPYEDNYEMMMLRDRIDGGAKGAATVLELSQRCDEAFKFSPTFAMPG